VSALLSTWDTSATGEERRQILTHLTLILTAFSTTVRLGCPPSPSQYNYWTVWSFALNAGLKLDPGPDWVDKLVALYLGETGNLAGLAQGAGILPASYR
jgi:hypothetical protein